MHISLYILCQDTTVNVNLQAAVVSEVAKLMEAAGMQELLCLTKARIPVVKFVFRHPTGAVKVR